MNKTASMVLKIIGASLAFAAVVCLLIGGWHDLAVGCKGVKKRLTQKIGSEYDDYAEEELYEWWIPRKRPHPLGWGRFFASGLSKSGRKKSPAAANFPLTGVKNHGKIRRLYDGRGYSAIFYR